MDNTATAILAVLMRWTHILSMAVLLGGILYARFAMSPAIAPEADAARISDRATAAFRGMLLAAMAGLVGSGIYNFLTKTSYPRGYHMWFGIKMLLALHIFAVGFLLATRPLAPAKRDRLATGVAISGALVLLFSAILRYLSLNSWQVAN